MMKKPKDPIVAYCHWYTGGGGIGVQHWLNTNDLAQYLVNVQTIYDPARAGEPMGHMVWLKLPASVAKAKRLHVL